MTETQYLLAIVAGLLGLVGWLLSRLFNKIDNGHASVDAVRMEVAELRGTVRERNETLALLREILQARKRGAD